MTGKWKESCTVVSQEAIAGGIFSLWLQTDRIAAAAVPGQFVSVYSNDRSRMLPRPISICETDRDSGRIRLVYRVAGSGTAEFSSCLPGDSLDLIGPLGNGFPLEEIQKAGSVFLIGGGIGIPPMLQLAKELPGEKTVIAGYRDELFLDGDLGRCGRLFIASEDGKHGTKGNVLDCIRENHLTADAVCACGPTPMLKALSAWAEEQGIPCWISLEQRMACGIGACLACVCGTREEDPHTKVRNTRICCEGPVFRSTEVEL